MAIFMDTGGGDIYAAETKEACLEAMRKDIGDKAFAEIERDTFEVSGEAKMRIEAESDDELPTISTLAEEYVNLGHGYCIASENC
jgi:hypothetical protein